MANMSLKKTEIIRADPMFKKFVDEMCRFKSYQEKDKITSSRITKAMYNQYNKYPELLEELKKSKLGKWSSR